MTIKLLKKSNMSLVLLMIVGTLLCLCFCVGAFAIDEPIGGAPSRVLGIGRIAWNAMSSFYSFGTLVVAFSYISGLGFAISALFKFKQYKDNPTQIPITTPLALFAVGLFSMTLPGIVAPLGRALFGEKATKEYLDARAGGFTGGGAKSMSLPGIKKY